ncbi:MAG: glycoside hydrolase family 3 [Bacteroidetes bacterium 4572_77]|nr:MAG: glycoside hydrolase family 3 [Bacteroidetes bacterium 4572_77]
MQKRSFLFSVLFLLSFWAVAQDSLKQHWVDSVYQSLSVKERFGQLLMVRANHSSKSYDPQISQYIQEYNIGGVCFFKSTPQKQRQQTNLWQAQSSLPLLVSIDAEWGLGMRLKQTISYPFQMTLGSITNDSLIYEMGKQIGQQCRRLGIHLNFAPVVDINNNPNNPVINSRSFGDDPKKVAQKAAMYMQGLQDAQIIATAKHFPGHGDTETDSHKTLPIVAHDKNRLEAVELYPYKQLINRGLSGVMVAHLYVPAYEKEKNVATTLSKAVVSDLLQDQLGFKGLVVTDALDMKGVTKYFPSGEIEVRALLAGNDILLLPENTPMAIKGLFQAYESGRIPPELLKEKCKKILAYKYDLGLTQKQEVSEENLISDLNKPEDKALREILFDHAITLIENKNVLPLARQGDTTLAVISFGMKKNAVFEKTAKIMCCSILGEQQFSLKDHLVLPLPK